MVRLGKGPVEENFPSPGRNDERYRMRFCSIGDIAKFCLLFGCGVTLLFSGALLSAQQGQITDQLGENAVPRQDDPSLEGPALVQQASYVIGQQLVADFKQGYLDVDAQALLQGIQDAFEGRESKIPADRVPAIMMAFTRKQQQKMQEMADRNLAAGQQFLKENALKPGVKQLENGVQYIVMQAGTGPSPKETDKVTVHYVGSFIDGTVFESSIDRGEPATFMLNGVIEGWSKTIPRMKVGDKWKLFIPSSLAYREFGQPGIQPNQTLIFEIELLDIPQQ